MGIFGKSGKGRVRPAKLKPSNGEKVEDEKLEDVEETEELASEVASIKIRKLDEKASDPVIKSFGFKVFSGEEKVILISKSNAVVDTKLEVEVPGGYYLRVSPSSSFGFNSDIVAFSGILEEGKHNIKIKFYNNSNRVKEFKLGEALADIEVLQVNYFDLEIGE